MLRYCLYESDLIITGTLFYFQKHNDQDNRMAYMDFDTSEGDVSDCMLCKVKIWVTLLF